MNEGVLAPALLSATLGLALSIGGPRRVLAGVAAMLAGAFVTAALPVDAAHAALAIKGCWLGVVAAAACMHLPRPPGGGWIIASGLIAGAWTGATAAAIGQPFSVVLTAPWILLALPGAWLVAGKRGIFVKVAGSWLAAAALLSLGLNMVATLGNEPDHME